MTYRDLAASIERMADGNPDKPIDPMDWSKLLNLIPLYEIGGYALDELTKGAANILRRDYYSDVRDATQSILDAIRDGEIPDRDSLIERIDEESDGAGRVIYTAQAMDCVRYSDNDSAYFEEFGTEGAISDGDINWSAIASMAFRRDIIEQLDVEGIDVNNFDPDASEETAETD